MAHTDASTAIEKLDSFALQPAVPFFLAVGFLLPHGPFAVPPSVWGLYDSAASAMLATHESHVAPPLAWHGDVLFEPPYNDAGLPDDGYDGAVDKEDSWLLCRLNTSGAEQCCCDCGPGCEAQPLPSHIDFRVLHMVSDASEMGTRACKLLVCTYMGYGHGMWTWDMAWASWCRAGVWA